MILILVACGRHQGRPGGDRPRSWSSPAADIVVQPLESVDRAFDRSAPGDVVHAGQVLARLDPTFAAADMGTLAAQVSTLQAQVSRMQAEMENRPFTYTGLDPNMALQAAIFGQRQAEFNYKLENYQQKIDSLDATFARARADVASYARPSRLRQDAGGDAPPAGATERRLEDQHVVGDGQPRRNGRATSTTREQQAQGAQRDLAAHDRRTQRLHRRTGTPRSPTS